MSRQSLLVAAALVIPPLSLAAQRPSEPLVHRLERPTATWSEPFSLIGGVRELADGRVVVSDPIEQSLQILDLSTGRAQALGRVGQGPGEFRSPDALLPLPGGQTLLVDLGNGRLTRIDADGRLGASSPMAQGGGAPGGGAAGLRIVIPRTSDASGRVYFQPPTGGLGPGGAPPDSAAIVRVDLEASRFDTVAFIKVAPPVVRTSGTANNQNVRAMPRPFPRQDGWAVAPDGRVAIVRADPYRVEWVTPTGRVSGPPVTWRPVPVRAADREEWAEAAGSGLSLSVENRNGEITTSFSRGRPGQRPDLSGVEWPDVKPPFPSGAVFAAPNGELWVERSVAAGAAREYDRFDGRGALLGRVVLRARSRVVGFGSAAVYVVRRDADDLQYLERYARP